MTIEGKQRLSSTGSPQGCVLSPLLFSLYTNDCRRQSKDRHIHTFAYDTVVVSLLHGSESSHGPVVSHLVHMCDVRFLGLNTFTNLNVMDSRGEKRRRSLPPSQTSRTKETKRAISTLAFTVYWLEFELRCEAICKKRQQIGPHLHILNWATLCVSDVITNQNHWLFKWIWVFIEPMRSQFW